MEKFEQLKRQIDLSCILLHEKGLKVQKFTYLQNTREFEILQRKKRKKEEKGNQNNPMIQMPQRVLLKIKENFNCQLEFKNNFLKKITSYQRVERRIFLLSIFFLSP